MKDEHAAASVIAFAVAGGIFLLALTTLFLVAQSSVPRTAASTDPRGAIQADALVSALVGPTTDAGWMSPSTPPTWGATSSGVPGLLDDTSTTGRISIVKVQELQKSVGAPAGLVYSSPTLTDARHAFGLIDGQEFHVRFRPQLPPTVTGLKVTYVGTTPSTEKDRLDAALGALSTPDATFATTPTCATVDVIVVGTNFAGSPPALLGTWVQNCGTLILLSSPTRCTCLSVLPAAAATDSKQLRGGDSQHPLLTIPNSLASNSYASVASTSAWPEQTDGFSTIAGPVGAPLIQLSNAGAFGIGEVILVNVQPTAVFGGAGTTDSEATRLFSNLISRHHRELFLDWGAALPEDSDAQPAVVAAKMPLGSRDVLVQVAVYLFTHPT